MWLLGKPRNLPSHKTKNRHLGTGDGFSQRREQLQEYSIAVPVSKGNRTMQIKAIIETGDKPVTLTSRGCLAWTLCELPKTGEKGITSLHNSAPRILHCVMTIRRKGLVIETIRAEHGGAFPGVHGIYKLVSRVTVQTVGGGA
jgi:hypothetical protein